MSDTWPVPAGGPVALRPGRLTSRDVPPPTAAELDAVEALLRQVRPPALTLVVGSGRGPHARAGASALADRWAATGGTVLLVMDWPEEAASWLRAARRFVEPAPDAWAVVGPPQGWAQMSRRLRRSTDWDPARTVGFATLGDVRLLEVAGADAVAGMRGARTDGSSWRLHRAFLATQALPDERTGTAR